LIPEMWNVPVTAVPAVSAAIESVVSTASKLSRFTPAGAVTVIVYRPPIVGVNVIVAMSLAAAVPGTTVAETVAPETATSVTRLLSALAVNVALEVTSAPFGSRSLKVGATSIVCAAVTAAPVVRITVAVTSVPCPVAVVLVVEVAVTE
jgi:hypothetical protein